jgi:hypothetical protein
MKVRVGTNRMVRFAAVSLAIAVFGAPVAAAPTALGRTRGAATPLRSHVPALTLTASPIASVPRTLRSGTAVEAGELGQRVFVDSMHGFALASVGQAQYPAITVDAGTTWQISGPALHLDAAQAPLSVCAVGAVNRRTYFAYGCGEVIDTTNDGGKHWWRTFLGGGSLAVAVDGGHLVAFVNALQTNGSKATTWAYVSSDGGRHWRYESHL